MSQCKVVFGLRHDAPAECVDAWKTMVKSIDNHAQDEVWTGLHNTISHAVRASAALHKNDANILRCFEGGFGGDTRYFDRQIRFDCCQGRSKELLIMVPSDGLIPLPPGHPEAADHRMDWTIPDLIDFKYAAAVGMNAYMHETARPGVPATSLCIHADISFSHLGTQFGLPPPEAEKREIDYWVNKKDKRALQDSFNFAFFKSAKEIQHAVIKKHRKTFQQQTLALREKLDHPRPLPTPPPPV